MNYRLLKPMRTWSNPCPDIPYNYMTLYELAVSLYEQAKYNEPDTPESDIQDEAIPRLTEWIFEKYYGMFNTVADQAIATEFIEQFMNKFINMEICCENPDHFRSRLYIGLRKAYPYLTQATPEYMNLVNASVQLTRSDESTNTGSNTSKTTGSRNDSQTIKRDHSGTDEYTDSSTGNTTSDTTSSQDSTTTVTGGSDTTVTDNTTRTTTNTHDDRTVHSDYPQSVVNAGTSGNPDVMSWTYASNSDDNHGGSTDTTKNTGTTTTDVSSNSSTKVTGTVDGDITTNTTGSVTHSGEDSYTDTETHTGTGSDTTETTGSSNGTTTSSGSSDSMSAFEKTMKVLDYLRIHPYKPIYDMLSRLEIYFMAEYVEEERDGYIDIDTDIMKYLKEVTT